MIDAKDNELDKILAESPAQYFFHKEENGEVTVVFTSGIRKVDPGNEDSVGRMWNPKTIDDKGQVKEPWSKFEATVMMDGVPFVYSFGGKGGSLLIKFVSAMKYNGISNADLPGTKWSINRASKWDWVMKYLGREAVTIGDTLVLFKTALKAVKEKNAPVAMSGFNKADIISSVCFLTKKKPQEINDIWSQLLLEEVISEKDGKIFIR